LLCESLASKQAACIGREARGSERNPSPFASAGFRGIRCCRALLCVGLSESREGWTAPRASASLRLVADIPCSFLADSGCQTPTQLSSSS
jgi:hypothetical protein